MPTGTVALAVDFGTSNTVAMLRRGSGPPTPLLFDASPMLPSGVFAGPDGDLLTGADAERAASGFPAGLEANPKRRIADGTVWLGEREVPVADLAAAVLARVRAEAVRVAGQVPDAVVLTHPVAWSRSRLNVLGAAARAAGLGEVGFVAEPVAAAAYFATVLGHDVPVDHCLVVYDLGGGTIDITVLRRQADGFAVIASGGLPDLGGLDLDATVVDHARSMTAGASEAWNRLDWPQNTADQRARRLLWRDAQAVKEQLSRHVRADLHIPLVDTEVQLTREEFDKAAQPLLEQTVEVTLATLRGASVPRERVAGVFLVGGSSRVPLAASLLHRALNIAPTVIEQPELVVAEGALHAMPALPPVHVERTAPMSPPPPFVAAPMAFVPPAVPDRRRRRWWLPAAAAAVATVVAAGAIIVGVKLYQGSLQAGTTPPSTAPGHRPSASPSVSRSAGAAVSPTVHVPNNTPTVGGVEQAKQLIPRLPARIRAMHCIAQVTDTTPAIPMVTCGDQQKTSVIYALYPSVELMNEDLQVNLDPSQNTGGDCATTPSHALTTYTRGGHHGRILCEIAQGSGYIGWTDENNILWGQIPPTEDLTYKKIYELWTSAVDIAPA
jgi:hypothetical protein